MMYQGMLRKLSNAKESKKFKFIVHMGINQQFETKEQENRPALLGFFVLVHVLS